MKQEGQGNADFRFPLQLVAWGDRFRCPIPIKLNTYRGCEYNCKYCYLYKSRRVKGVKEDKPIPTKLEDIKKKFFEVDDGIHDSYLHRCLKLKIPLQLGTSTDPFQPCEKKEKITYKTIEFLKEINYPFMMITKGIIPEEYMELMQDTKCVVQSTLLSLDQKFLNKIQPNAPSAKKKLQNMEKLTEFGIDHQLKLWPIFPMLNDTTQELIETVAETGCNDVIASFLRIFKYGDYRERLNDALGFDYLQYLHDEHYPITQVNDYFWPTTEEKDRVYSKIKWQSDMNFYTPDILRYNNFECCCGTEPYFGKHAPWALQTNINKIQKHTTYSQYMDGCECPYDHQFRRLWNKGQISKYFTDIIYNKVSNTYSRKTIVKQQTLYSH